MKLLAVLFPSEIWVAGQLIRRGMPCLSEHWLSGQEVSFRTQHCHLRVRRPFTWLSLVYAVCHQLEEAIVGEKSSASQACGTCLQLLLDRCLIQQSHWCGAFYVQYYLQPTSHTCLAGTCSLFDFCTDNHTDTSRDRGSLEQRCPNQHFTSNLCILNGLFIINSTVMDTKFDSIRARKLQHKKRSRSGQTWSLLMLFPQLWD